MQFTCFNSVVSGGNPVSQLGQLPAYNRGGKEIVIRLQPHLPVTSSAGASAYVDTPDAPRRSLPLFGAHFCVEQMLSVLTRNGISPNPRRPSDGSPLLKVHTWSSSILPAHNKPMSRGALPRTRQRSNKGISKEGKKKGKTKGQGKGNDKGSDKGPRRGKEKGKNKSKEKDKSN